MKCFNFPQKGRQGCFRCIGLQAVWPKRRGRGPRRVDFGSVPQTLSSSFTESVSQLHGVLSAKSQTELVCMFLRVWGDLLLCKPKHEGGGMSEKGY